MVESGKELSRLRCVSGREIFIRDELFSVETELAVELSSIGRPKRRVAVHRHVGGKSPHPHSEKSSSLKPSHPSITARRRYNILFIRQYGAGRRHICPGRYEGTQVSYPRLPKTSRVSTIQVSPRIR